MKQLKEPRSSNIWEHSLITISQGKKRISHICAKATADTVKIKTIRSFLTNETAKILMVGLVLSHLDANNGILIELPDTQQRRLQLVHNYAAKVVCKKRKYDSASECLMTLHRLPCEAKDSV